MKESTKYLFFLRRYIFIYLFFISVFAGIAFWVFSSQPEIHKFTVFFELKSFLDGIEKKERIADEVVTQLRSKNIQYLFNTEGSEKLTVFKPGPFAIQLEVMDEDKSKSEKVIKVAELYILENFEVDKKGLITHELVEVKPWKYLVLGILGGILAGVAYSLIREYFRLF